MLRRPHKKSRRGCKNCKQRRVKRDEKKPTCSNCILRKFDCAYAFVPHIVWMDEKSNSVEERESSQTSHERLTLSRQESSGSQERSKEEICIPANLNLEGIELVIHWFTKTAYTVAGTPAAVQVVQTVILQQAMTHHFLLHGILALSALHLAHFNYYSNPALHSKYTQIATAHHNQGLAQYHSVLEDINAQNYSASIAFSSITVIYAFALATPGLSASGREGTELLVDLVQIFLLAKGWDKVVSMAREIHHDLLPLQDRASFNLLPPSTAIAFGRLHEFAAAKSQEEDRQIYKQAIDALESSLMGLNDIERNRNPHVVLEWPESISREFVLRLEEQQPLALVIVAFYCVVLDREPSVWWLDGWSTRLLRVIWVNLEYEYQKEVEWVRNQIGLDCVAKL